MLSPVICDGQQEIGVRERLDASEISDLYDYSAHTFSEGSNCESESIESFGWNTLQKSR